MDVVKVLVECPVLRCVVDYEGTIYGDRARLDWREIGAQYVRLRVCVREFDGPSYVLVVRMI